jgi:methylphosphotriester-DNA--protein-cysteine methyltransferase
MVKSALDNPFHRTFTDYHRLKPENVVPFFSEGAALAAGYRKAKNCP